MEIFSITFILVTLQVISVAEGCGVIRVPGHFSLISKQVEAEGELSPFCAELQR